MHTGTAKELSTMAAPEEANVFEEVRALVQRSYQEACSTPRRERESFLPPNQLAVMPVFPNAMPK